MVAQDTKASPNSLETQLVKKSGDIGHQRAVGPGNDMILYIHMSIKKVDHDLDRIEKPHAKRKYKANTVKHLLLIS